MRRRRTRAAGSSRRAPRVVPSTGIGARAGPCTSFLGPPRGGGRGGRRGRRGGSDVFRSPRPTPRIAALVVDSRQWLWLVLLASFPRAVFYCVVVRPMMLVNMAGMKQKDSYAARRPRPSSIPAWHVQGWYCWVLHLALYSFFLPSTDHGNSPVASGQCVDVPLWQVLRAPQVQTVLMTVVIPQLHLIVKIAVCPDF